MKASTSLFFLCAGFLGAESFAMHQQSVRSIGPSLDSSALARISEKPESVLKKIFSLPLSNRVIKLPEELFTLYKPIAESVRGARATRVHKEKIQNLVPALFTKGTPEQQELVSRLLYEDLLDNVLERCTCDDAPLKKRIELLLDLKSRMHGRDKNEPIVFTSLASGQLLQELWTIRELQGDGFKNLTVNIINAALTPDFAHHHFEEEEYYSLQSGIEELSKSTGLGINHFDHTKKIVLGQINIFSNAYDYYIRASLENAAFKSTCMTLIDPKMLQNSGKSEMPNVLAIYTEQKDEDEAEYDYPADVLISFTNKENPRVYMQPIACDMIAEVVNELVEYMKDEIDPITLKKKLRKKFPQVDILEQSSLLRNYHEMVELSLADTGTAYILADQFESVTHHEVKALTRSNFRSDTYLSEVETAEVNYLHFEGYVDAF